MKKSIYLVMFYSLFSFSIYAQNIAITDDDTYTAHSSAMLDVKSITKGLLVPRLTTIERTSIGTPANGLLVFDTDIKGFYYYSNGTWINLTSGTSSSPFWGYNSPDIYMSNLTDRLGLGTSTPSCRLHLKMLNTSISGGIRLETSQATAEDWYFYMPASDNLVIRNDVSDYVTFEMNTGNVGIGFTDPTTKLDVNGTTKTTNFQMTNGAIAGYYLQSDASGNASWVDMVAGADADWTINGNNIYAANSGMVGIGTTTPGSKLIVRQTTTGIDEAIFAVQNNNGDTVFAVYPEGVRIWVNDAGGTKATGSRGGFAVGGFSPAKAGFTNEYLRVTPDSVRIYIDDDFTGSKATGNRGGFAVGGFSPAKGSTTHDYLFVQDDSTRVYVADTTNGFGVGGIGSSSVDPFLNLTTENTFIGYFSGYSTVPSGLNGKYNTYIGHESGFGNVSGANNLFMGYLSGRNCISSYNIFIGNEAGKITTGDYNIFIGEQSGLSNQGGNNNVFMGFRAGQDNTEGYYNLFLGYRSGADNTLGFNNVFIGRGAGEYNLVGNNNLYMGAMAGYITKGSGNVFIGYQAGYFQNNVSDLLFIENSNTNSPLIWGNFATDDIQINGDICWTGTGGVCSDKRYKKNIVQIENALESLNSISGVYFDWRIDEFPDRVFKDRKQIGVIAQDVETVYPELIDSDKDGYKVVDYSKLSAILIQAVKEQQDIIEKQQTAIEALKQENQDQNKENEKIKAEVEKIKSIIDASVKNN